MKLVRFGPPGKEKPGVWLDDAFPGMPGILDVRAMAFDIADYDAHFFTHFGIDRVRNLLTEPKKTIVPGLGMRLGPPVVRPAQIVCVGKNYAEHAKETGSEPPKEPLFFAKAVSSLSGSTDPIVLPAESRRVDAEAELAIVFSRRARRVSEADAFSFIAGYTIVNDVSDRDAQAAGGQWFRGKSFDTFCPCGPWLVTPDEIADPQKLNVKQRLNSDELQSDSTSNMLFTIARLVAAITKNITLEPGDILATGTPAGIGSARNPPRVLATGDVVEIEIDGLGRQRNQVVAEKT
jgi:2-keto-4-pentenoate hydratase/2-oxohepta-3-ene-1,7-dioic acid hydratase in catechol pathway